MGPLLLGDLGLGGPEDPLLDEPPLGVEPVELVGDLPRARVVAGEQELERRVRARQPAGGVQPRGEAEADRAGVELARVGLRDPQQGAQPRAPRAGQRGQPGADEPPVLAAQRHAVGHRGQGDEVEVVVGARRIAARGRQQGGAELVGDAGGAEVRARVAAERRVDDRRVRAAAVGAGGVVVGDDDVQAGGARGARPRRPT